LESQQRKVGVVEAADHAVFYSICQAIFYVFVRRQDIFSRIIEDSMEVHFLNWLVLLSFWS
jgi:hypothetical protein